jgi:hypothetical protein
MRRVLQGVALAVGLLAGLSSVAPAQPIDLCVTTEGGGETRRIDVGITAYVEGSPTSPFLFYGSAAGETDDMQPVMGSAILRNGGLNLYFGLEGFPTQNHAFTREEGGSVSIFTLSGVGRRVKHSTTGTVETTDTTVQVALGPCS